MAPNTHPRADRLPPLFSLMARTDSNKKSKPSKGASKFAPPPKAQPAAAPAAPPPTDDLRQFVKDLGGDDDDYALIQGVDDDDEGDEGDILAGDDDAAADVSSLVKLRSELLKTDRALRQSKLTKELASFMKGLDFKALGATAAVDEGPDQVDSSEDEDADSSEGEMPVDKPKKVKEAVPEPPAVAQKEKKAAEPKKAVVATPAPQPALAKGKNGQFVSTGTVIVDICSHLDALPLFRYSLPSLSGITISSQPCRSSPPCLISQHHYSLLSPLDPLYSFRTCPPPSPHPSPRNPTRRSWLRSSSLERKQTSCLPSSCWSRRIP